MLSLVVPTLNAAATLERCLDALGQGVDLIVADGGSSDATRDIARAAGARIVETGPGRGLQLAAGARAAGGEWFLFLHADTRLEPGWREDCDVHMRTVGPKTAACLRFALDDPAWQARLIETGVALRVRLLGLPYGDQGLLISRSLYDKMGGYRPLPLMEDVDLVRRLGRRRLAVLPARAVTSAARWRRDGWARRSARNLACLALWKAGVPPERIARVYAAAGPARGARPAKPPVP
jgi:rSAM/selenodomain-associated transferase 2